MSTEITCVKDGDVIQSKMAKGGEKYEKLHDETWCLEAQSGNWGLVFDRFDVEPSEDCKSDYLLVKEYE